ncbi:hypothetical protein H5407_17325 [Mitsuaria sp. WAJ17]|uniref:hypothetical protein n=1 Tax=Mitsuaria sp. WAJ17 TaxID=2761452 RepID=UPI0015FF30D7|nr:hypothetical protein [Mitsuaria sp. WAJ17]MBB2486993.1 hypothetical protein [Mitsuaria sp. WAJ17]
MWKVNLLPLRERCTLVVFRRLVATLALASVVACGGRADEMPAKWAIAYEQKSIGQIVAEIGAPQEIASAKQFMNWVEPTATGTRLLKVMCPTKCDDTERPTEILFIVYRTGDSNPIRVTSLLKVSSNTKR